jgi:hypothetical protein
VSVLRQQEQQRLADEQARTLALVSEKQELEEKLTALSRTASGTILENFVDLQEYIRRTLNQELVYNNFHYNIYWNRENL